MATLRTAKCIPLRLHNLATNKDLLYVSLHHSRPERQQREEQRALAAFVEREESSPDGFDMVIIGGDTNAPPNVVRRWGLANTSILIEEREPVRFISNITIAVELAVFLSMNRIDQIYE